MDPKVAVVAVVALLALLALLALALRHSTQPDRPAAWSSGVRTYVISVPGTRPRDGVAARMSGKLPNLQFFDGVDGSSLKQRQGWLTPGELGCAASHMRLWEHILGADEPTLILEDDAELVGDFPRRFADLLRHVGDEVDIVFLGHCLEQRGKQYAPGLAASVTPRCTHGYLVTPRGVRKLVRWARSHTPDHAIDEELSGLVSSGYLTSLTSWPPLVLTTDDASMILQMGGRSYRVVTP